MLANAKGATENISTGTLRLVDQSGKALKTLMVDNHIDHLDIDVSEFPSGMYFYFIEYNNKRTLSQKLIIQ